MQCSLYRGENKKGGMGDWGKRDRRERIDLEREKNLEVKPK